ncbi:MAG: hypothetical protein ISS47_06075 [Candidatus Omnitrophica bacterium]|nr:hypothetical protein [Candidatus Omnitrophota bacterium]
MDKKSVIIFEDKKEEIKKLEGPFSKEFRKIKVPILFFESLLKDGEDSNSTSETKLQNELRTAKYKDVCLIICDSDLATIDKYPGLSEVVVSRVAEMLVIPICLYAQGVYKDNLEKIRQWSTQKIILDASKGYENLAFESRTIFEGFQEIETKYQKIIKTKKGKNYKLPQVLAHILGKPELDDRIAMYSTGDKEVLAEIMPHRKGADIGEKSKRIPRLLGYWLWNSILRFPGILLNKIAAASYLNIDDTEFDEKKKIQEVFKEALYDGPFSAHQTMWWRDGLDEILFKEKKKEGLELVHSKEGLTEVKDCKCSVDSSKRAGYYCMITDKPVSFENSQGNISWFPSGADLARISKKEFDELAPWLGLY